MQNCPYCNAGFSLDGISCDYSFPKFEKFNPMGMIKRPEGQKNMGILSHYCPECRKPIMWLYTFDKEVDDNKRIAHESIIEYELLYPKFKNPNLCENIPIVCKNEYNEAFLILKNSPKASAALSRRCLQMIIRNEENIKKRTLDEEIKALIELNKLPKYLADNLDYIRRIGNFAAHPNKSSNTAEIIDIEPGEAEWSLKLLEEVMLFYFKDLKENEQKRKEFEEKYGNK